MPNLLFLFTICKIANSVLAKIKYYYNTNTCKYERIITTWQDIVINFSGFSVLSILLSGCMMFAYFSFFDSPKEKLLKQEINKLKSNFITLNQEILKINFLLKKLTEKDNNVYRIIFENKQKDISTEIEKKENNFVETSLLSLSSSELFELTNQKIEKLSKLVIKENKSYDELLVLANKKSEMLASIPAILPVSSKQLRNFASGYGMRMHPIYKVLRFHAGCDFSAVRGTPIYATGDGIAKVKKDFEGYGNCIEINHGFGFMTRYGHCDKVKVRDGQKVNRGEIIGFVGSTGTATSPHLHYEVHKNGQTVDPVHYFFNDLNPSEYEELIKIAAEENQSLG